MKRLPFNACDYRCERCLETQKCAVFQRIKQPLNTLGEGDAAAVLRELRESFRDTEAMIKDKARQLGIDIDDIAGGATAAEIEEERKSRKDALFLRCEEFRIATGEFLKQADRIVGTGDGEYFHDIVWHHTVVPAKIYRAVGWRTDDEAIAIDGKNSAAVAMKSLTICIMAFNHLASGHPDLAAACRSLSGAAIRLKEDIKTRFFPAGAGGKKETSEH